ncbi:MAG: phosphopantothenoylcysteine decarboxylase domain-containing protein [Planctomycetota bacterium]
MRFLITAGPTREPIDEVRFLSNRSTGKMGFEVAREARRAGHEVVLVHGPVILSAPEGAEAVPVETALDMEAAVRTRLDWADALVMTAAVADYRPAERLQGKKKKSDEDWTLALVRNPDILAGAAETKKSRVHVGFAVESEDLLAGAARKLEAKRLDLIVANGLEAFGADTSTFHFLEPGRPPVTHAGLSKGEVARRIVAFCEGAQASRSG